MTITFPTLEKWNKMDSLGHRIIRDKREMAARRDRAYQLEQDAKKLRQEADEIERLMELARLEY